MEQPLTTCLESKKDQAQHPPKGERRDWVATRASLVFDERGTGHTPDGLWLYYPRPSSHDVLPAGHAAERAKWMFLGFEEEGPNAREILPSTDQESEKGDDIEMGGMEGPVDKNNNEVERGKGGGDALVGVEVGVAGLALSTIVAQ